MSGLACDLKIVKTGLNGQMTACIAGYERQWVGGLVQKQNVGAGLQCFKM